MRAKVEVPTDAEEAAIQRGIALDSDARELTDAEMAEMRPASEVMPELLNVTPRRRGPGKTPARAVLSLRVPPATLDGLRALGPGWRDQAVEALAAVVAERRKSGPRQ